MPEQSLNVFLHKAHHSFLAHRSIRWCRRSMLGDHFKLQNHHQKAQKYKTHDTKVTAKGTLVYSMRAETRMQRIMLLSLWWETCALGNSNFSAFCTVLRVNVRDHQY